jgi:hypothetical protein
MLSELEKQNRAAARSELVLAVWHGQEAERLLSLAGRAGLTGDEADRLIARISQAKERLTQVNKLPRLRKDAARANSRFEKVQARATADIARLEAEAQRAADEADVAQKAVHAAENSARQLLATYDEGLLAYAGAPEEVLRLIGRRDAEERFRQSDMARAAAHEERTRCRTVVRNIQDRLANVPITLSSRDVESRLRDRLKVAKRQLVDAESNLRKAEAEAAAARRAIPQLG